VIILPLQFPKSGNRIVGNFLPSVKENEYFA
jgi:hypothetical protein